MKFSQRIGKVPSEKLVQYEMIDDDLKNSLWNAITRSYLDRVSFRYRHKGLIKGCSLSDFFTSICLHLFKQRLDEIPRKFADMVTILRKWFYSAEWYEIFDFVESCAMFGPENAKEGFINLCNTYLKRENSAYRFVSGQLTEITCKVEIEEVESAISNPCISAGAKGHLTSALSLMNDRANPDYRNSIKESISAVESVAKILSGDEKATLGKALKVLEKNDRLHVALKSSFSALYGYTNDAEGIRHALMDKPTLTKADARFMLVSCSAFTNYLTELGSE